MPRTVEFTKMHGAGNDYIYVDTRRFPLPDPERLARLWSDRHKGIGGDGLVLIGPSEVADFSMRIFNADGSEARMCGNASRCIGKYVFDHGLTALTEVRLETLSGVRTLRLHTGADGRVESVTVDMGEPRFDVRSQMTAPEGPDHLAEVEAGGRAWRGAFVSMGNPHFVLFTPGAGETDVATWGPQLERAAAFPERCNIEFARVRPDGSIRMRVWERGSGITLACGTGACATAVAAARCGLAARHAEVEADGGRLAIEWREEDDRVLMTGPATEVFTGSITIEE